MFDRDQAGFRGPVKMCIEESIFPNQAAVRTTTEFRSDGKLIETRFDHGDGFKWVTAREYDSDGRLTKIKPANSADPTSEIVYVYDDAGRSLYITNTMNGDRTDFQYDDGRKIGTQRFDPETLQRSRRTVYGGSAWDAAASGAGIPLGGTITTIYDEEDRPVEMQTRDADSQIVARIIRTYNAAGLVAEEKPIAENPAAIFLDRIPLESENQPNGAQIEALNKGLKTLMSGRAETGTWHTYDDQNRPVMICERNYVFERITTIAYNDHGDKAEERSTIARNSIRPIGVAFSIEGDGTLIPDASTVERPPAPFDPPESSEVRYTYQYDDHGNWTEQITTYGINSDAPSAVRRRSLTYY